MLLLRAVDYIYHEAGVHTGVNQPRRVTEINISSMFNMLEAVHESDTERVVAKSSSVYGRSEYLPYDEGHLIIPVSPYGASKIAIEQYACVYSEVYGPPTFDTSQCTAHECARTRP